MGLRYEPDCRRVLQFGSVPSSPNGIAHQSQDLEKKRSKVTDLKMDVRGLRYIVATALAPSCCTWSVLHTTSALFRRLRGLWSKTFGSVSRRFPPPNKMGLRSCTTSGLFFSSFRSGDGESRSLIATSLLTAFSNTTTRHESRSSEAMDGSSYVHAGGGYRLGVEHKCDLEEPWPSKFVVRLDAEIAWFSRARKLAWT